jgi:hypothetical protein
LFAAESIWEHLELAFWPGLVWVAAAHRAIGVSRPVNLSIKGMTLLLAAILIVGISWW